MKDMQNKQDERGLSIHKVGIKGFQLPIYVRDKSSIDKQPSVGTFNVYSSLSGKLKGVHMSHFASVLQHHCFHEVVSLAHLEDVKDKIKEEQLIEMEGGDDISVHLEMEFTYFYTVRAPSSNEKGELPIACKFTVSDYHQSILEVKVPVTTLCPCSKEIAAVHYCPACEKQLIELPPEATGTEPWTQTMICPNCDAKLACNTIQTYYQGAHNQRSFITIAVQMSEWIWIEELVEYAQNSASCPVYPILRRVDEKVVTRRAFNNPKFVEDVIRDLEISIKKDRRLTWYSLHIENEESIHVHNAYAEKQGGGFLRSAVVDEPIESSPRHGDSRSLGPESYGEPRRSNYGYDPRDGSYF